MYIFAQIAGADPAWVLQVADPAELAGPLTDGTPVKLSAVSPYRGVLLLAPAAAASVCLFGPPGGADWVPSDGEVPAASIYVPTTAAPGGPVPLYQLGESDTLDGLATKILTAMSEGTVIPVAVSTGSQRGTVYLNGDTLPFAVLCPPNRAAAR
jgi:hypothetical protein